MQFLYIQLVIPFKTQVWSW